MIFEPFVLSWEGVEYTIKGDDRFMEIIACIENHLTMQELTKMLQTGEIKNGKISMAYSVALRYGGCKVSSAEVYEGMWKDVNKSSAIEALIGLFKLMTPPSIFQSYFSDIVEEQEESVDNKPKSKKKPKESSQ